MIYFVQISDTHIGPTAVYTNRHGFAPYPCAERLVEIINELPQTPDFVIHTGDVVYDPDPAAFELAAALFARLNVPIYYVNGNHDGKGLLKQYLPMGPKEDLGDDLEEVSYAFMVKGYRFLVLDARGPYEIDPRGRFSGAQLAIAEQETGPDGPPLTVFMHYPVWPLNSSWMDAHMLVENGRSLHTYLLTAQNRLRGVFHGHVHQPMQTMRDGILYVSAASGFIQLAAWPGDTAVVHDFAHDPGYSFVHLLPEQTIIHQHTFPRPGGRG